MGAMKEVFVPDIGDFKSVDVIEILVKPGDTVQPEQSLVTLESDKATMEIPSPSAGVVKEVRVKVGDKVSEGSAILVLESAEAAKSAATTEAAKSAATTEAAKSAATTEAAKSAATTEAAKSAATTEAAKSAATTEVAKSAATTGAAKASAPSEPAKPPTVAAAPGGVRRVDVPDIGDFKSVDVIEILVKPGDSVEPEQSLVTLESDKATMEVPSPAAGKVKEILIRIGDQVSQGSPILVLEEVGGAPASRAAAPAAAPPASAAKAEASAPATAPSRPPPVAIEPAAEPAGRPHASPSVRKFARELGVDLARVRGSGPKNRILQSDVQAFVKGVMAHGPAPAAAAGAGLGLLPWPQVDFAKFGPVETVPLPRIKKISGPTLHRNWVMIPHVTNHDDADITELEAFRVQLNKENEKSGVKVTMLAFLIKACVAALRKFPDFNSSLAADGAAIVVKKYWHIGFAADTPGGLVVPVVRDADKKGILEIATETAELAKLARDGKLKPADMQGGTFSISSLGGIGGTYFTPIINAPEVAILGVCRSATRPVWDGKQFAPRLVLPLSLSWDHRVIDGASAARFNGYLAQLLADFRRAML